MDTHKTNMRTFYALILTQVFSLMGSRISGLAISIWIFAETGNATPLLLVSFFAVLPQVIASSIAGVLSDRWDRRYVMVLSDAGQAIGTVLLLLSFTSGSFEVWHLYIVTFIQAVFGVFQGPAFQATVTMLIPDEKRDGANTIQQLTGPMAGIFAPPIAGLVYAAVGVTGAIVVDLLTFIVAMAVIFSMNIPRPEQTETGRDEQGSMWYEMLTGFRFVAKYRGLTIMVIYLAFLNFLVAGSMGLAVPYILARTDNNEVLLGILQATINIGAIAGGIFFGMWGGTRPRVHTIFPGIIVASLFLIALGTSQHPIILGVMLFAFMFPLPMVNASAMSILQVKTPPDIQGRVFAFIGQISILLTPLAYLVAGPLTDQLFEPAVGTAGWEVVAPLVGASTGSGMGMIMVIGGVTSFFLSVVIYSLPVIRTIEERLPDYVPAEQPADVTTTSETPAVA